MSRFVKLTAPNDKAFWVDPTSVCVIETAIAGDRYAKSQIRVGDSIHYSKETPEEVLQMLEESK